MRRRKLVTCKKLKQTFLDMDFRMGPMGCITPAKDFGNRAKVQKSRPWWALTLKQMDKCTLLLGLKTEILRYASTGRALSSTNLTFSVNKRIVKRAGKVPQLSNFSIMITACREPNNSWRWGQTGQSMDFQFQRRVPNFRPR